MLLFSLMNPFFPSYVHNYKTDDQPSGNYWVLDTDYETYSLVHSCGDFFFKIFHLQIEWILSPQRTLDEATLNQLYGKLEEQGISTDPFIFTDQSDCTDTKDGILN